mgnify:CR=1 FL=1
MIYELYQERTANPPHPFPVYRTALGFGKMDEVYKSRNAMNPIPTAFFKEIDPLVVDSPAYHDILADGLGGGDQGVNERRPLFL